MSDKPETGELTPEELKQVTLGFSQWVRQPVNAARYFTRLLLGLNGLFRRVQELEKKVQELGMLCAPLAEPGGAPLTPEPKSPAPPPPQGKKKSDAPVI